MPAFLSSELPVRVEVRHHWIVMFRRPPLVLGIALVILLVLAITDPWPMALVLILLLGIVGFLRWQTWSAERITLTQKRIVRVRGVPETTKTEASLRLDRISGAIIEQSVMGKLLGYATIQLEAAGNHPDVRHLVNIAHPHEFYSVVREVVFGGTGAPGGSGRPTPDPLVLDDEGPTLPPIGDFEGDDPTGVLPDDTEPW